MSEHGRLLVVGLEGERLSASERQLLRRITPAGVILFTRNLVDAASTHALIQEIRQHAGPETLLMIDQEGGSVDRWRGWVPSAPSAMALGAANQPSLTREVAHATGSLLALLGFDLDLAPVVDLALSRADNAIGTRSFGHLPERVEVHARAFLDGLTAAGVHGCIKHFPGLGSSELDSHLSLPVMPVARAQLERGELRLYRALAAHAGAVLVGHGYYPELTRRGIEPASLSREITTELLRHELGFQGVALSDDLTMGAVMMEDIAEAAVNAVVAGCDLLLVCRGEDESARVLEALERASRCGTLSAERLQQARQRVAALVTRIDSLAGKRPSARRGLDQRRLRESCTRLAELAERAARRSVTPLSGRVRRWPRSGRLLVLRPELRWIDQEQQRRGSSPFSAPLVQRGYKVDEHGYTLAQPAEALQGVTLDAYRGVVIATFGTLTTPRLAPVATSLADHGLPLLHLSLGMPSRLKGHTVIAEIASYGCGWDAIATGMAALLGQLKAGGQLPLPPELYT